MVHNRALWMGIDFAKQQGDTSSSARYAQASSIVNATLMGHWNGQFIIESTNRPMDGAVLAALNEAYQDDLNIVFTPTSSYVASTITATINAMCSEFPINNIDSAAGIPGVLIGRYPGDHYGLPRAGPWILLSAYLAQSFYRAAAQTRAERQLPPVHAMSKWRELMPHLSQSPSYTELADSLFAMGDGVMQRIYYHVQGGGFHLSEQLDAQTGVLESAYDLTWSYATVLKALQLRNKASSSPTKQKF